MSLRWDDGLLDQMRREGDPLADEAVEAVFESSQLSAVRRLMDTLAANDEVLPADLPAELKGYLDRSAEEAASAFRPAEGGQELFSAHGPEILLILACYSLPMAYAARKGVKVLHETAYLERRPNRRLFQTAQMVVDVMTPGGLGPRGKGIRTAQKVRLMHAAIRHLILHNQVRPWNHELGVPINQEDLAGTLMSFSWIVMDGLRKLDVDISSKNQEAYLDTWLDVGRLLGVRPELLPRSLTEAGQLTDSISKRQLAPSDEGCEMLAALLGMLTENSPPFLKGFPAALMRRFLASGIADGLRVPNLTLERLMASGFAALASGFDRIIGASKQRESAFRCFSLHFIQWMIDVDLGGSRAKFNIPDHLHDYWGIAPGGQGKSFWQRLVDRYL